MCGVNTTSKNKPISRLLLGTAIGLTLSVVGGFATPAGAQEIVLEEIIVTAQKREQLIEDIPASVSAISGDTVRDYLGSAENIRALANRVPSLNIESSNGRTQPRLYMRGLGNIDFDNNAAQPVGMVYDEIFLEGNVLRSLPIFDVERVEVLAGPQGTLFGRNTNAGLVKIDSARPSDERDAYVSASFGQRSTLAVEGAGNAQIAENTYMRASVKYQSRSDWIDNVAADTPGDDFGEFDEKAWRLQFLYQPSDTFSGLVKLHGFNQDGSHPQVFYAGAIESGTKGLRSGFDETKATHDSPAGMDLSHKGIAVNLAWDVDEFTFTSITGWDEIENFQSADIDGGIDCPTGDLGCQGRFSSETGDGLDEHRQFTQEFRLARDAEDSFFQVGMYFLNEDFTVRSEDFGFFRSTTFNPISTDSFALFSQVELRASDQFSLTFGARFTDEKKELGVIPAPGAPVSDGAEVDDTFFNWDAAFTFDINDDWSLYGRYANASRGPSVIGRFGIVSTADTETTNSVEFGFKSNLLDGRARWNTSFFSYTNDDQQLVATGGVGNANRLLNARRVDGLGFETDFEILVTDNFLLLANASYNDTEIDDPELLDELGLAPGSTSLDPIVDTTRIGIFGPVIDVSIDGNPLPRAPKWQYNIILQYSIPIDDGEFYAYTDWNYRDESNLFLHETVEFVAEERWLGGLRLGYRSDAGLDVAIVGRNITDEIVVDGGINFINLTAFVNEPSFWGIEVRKAW